MIIDYIADNENKERMINAKDQRISAQKSFQRKIKIK